jgi:hypothetical protein
LGFTRYQGFDPSATGESQLSSEKKTLVDDWLGIFFYPVFKNGESLSEPTRIGMIAGF